MKRIADLPPGPFTYETTAAPGEHHGKGHVYIIDGTGRKIASLWGPADVKLAMAMFIIEARRDQSSVYLPVATDDVLRRKILAIKARLEETGGSLLAAKTYVEANPHLWAETP